MTPAGSGRFRVLPQPTAPTPVETNEAEAEPTSVKDYEAISLEEVLAQWAQVLAKLKENNQSLGVILNSAKPVKTDSGVITLAFQYAFYQDRLKDAACRKTVEETISEVFNKRLGIDTTVDNTEPVATTPENVAMTTESETDMSDLANAFGGEVVAS